MVAADILSQYELERTVRFIFFTGEEQGLYGSKEYADLVYDAGENIVAVYNMDMIAWDVLDGPTLRLHTRTTSSSGYPGDRAIADLFVDVVNTYDLSSSLTPIIDPDGVTASDHSPFWSKGYSAILAIEDDQDDFCAYYHTANDTLSTLNMTYFTNYTKASVGTAAYLARSGGGTPEPTPMFVYNIDMSGNQKGANLSATAVVTIHDFPDGNPVEGATVSGAWSGDYNADVSDATNADGQVTFTSGKVKKANATFTFTVNDVVKSGYVYDPGLNEETSDTIVVD